MQISKFKNIFESKDGSETSVSEFINQVKFGEWRDISQKIAAEEQKEARQELKKSLPYVTPSGLFTHRKKDGLVQHSGFICLDFDDLEDVDKAFADVCKDPHSFAAFRSVSGRGLAVLVKINPKRHLDAFLGLERYFANKYLIGVDKACKDTTRPRYVSYDPDAYLNDKSIKFESYLPKSERTIKLPKVISGDNDIDFILSNIHESGVDLTGGEYYKYLEIGFAIAEKFGEGGRYYFHQIAQNSDKYSQKGADKQFDHCIKSGGSGVTFATLLYHVKNAGLPIISPETKHVANVANMAKNAGRGIREVINTIKKVDPDIAPEIVEQITGEVFKREELGAEMELDRIPALELFLQANYDLKRNEITRFIESGDGEEIDTVFTNSVYIKARKELDDRVKFDEIDKLIGSDFTPSYNPVKEYFESRPHVETGGVFRDLANCIDSDTGAGSDYVFLMLKKWLVGVVASVYGHHSPLLLVFTGGQRTGKTEFFRRLLPGELQRFYAESKLDAGKDDEILMTQKIIILDDEFGGKSKLESKRLKELTSKQFFTLREPYGRKNVSLKRLSCLCGTSNDEQLLNDPTGNRRIIPIRIKGIDHDKYNKIDKTALLMEAYNEFKAGFDYELNGEDVQLLNDSTKGFEQVRPEKELILKHFKPTDSAPGGIGVEFMQTMEIKAYLERLTGQKLIIHRIKQELAALNYMETVRSFDGQERRGYSVVKRNEMEAGEAIIREDVVF